SLASLFSFIITGPPRSSLFPYTTLFRSRSWGISSKRRHTSPVGPRPYLGGSRMIPWYFEPRRTSRATYLRASSTIQRTGRSSSRSEEHTSELQSRENLVCRLLLEKKK